MATASDYQIANNDHSKNLVFLAKFAKNNFMAIKVEQLEDPGNFRLFLTISYKNLLGFVFEYLNKKSILIFLFWSLCLLFLGLSVLIIARFSGRFNAGEVVAHAAIGLIILPLLFVPVHEILHVIPYFVSGARNIRFGMDLKQYMFYVTAHRYVAAPLQFKIVALAPFAIISICLLVLIAVLPGLWKISLSVFLFVHATMCAGDFALLNLYFLNRDKEIYTWDDADKKEAYFYEKI
jgi:hypothetical protein